MDTFSNSQQGWVDRQIWDNRLGPRFNEAKINDFADFAVYSPKKCPLMRASIINKLPDELMGDRSGWLWSSFCSPIKHVFRRSVVREGNCELFPTGSFYRYFRALPAGPRELPCCRVLYLTDKVQLLNNQGGARPSTHTCTQELELDLTLWKCMC